jgi:hypothetical protein
MPTLGDHAVRSAVASRSRSGGDLDLVCGRFPFEGRSRGGAGLGRARQNGAWMSCDWLLIDGSSLIFRAYYGALASARTSRGADVNAIGGVLDRLARLVGDRQPRQLVIADDWAWRPKWRVVLIAAYKAHRVAEPVPGGLAPCLPVIGQLLEHVGIDAVGVADYEAEDVIATLTRLAPWDRRDRQR